MVKKETIKPGIDIARELGFERMENSPKARKVSLDKSGQTLKIELINDVVLMVPTRLVQILSGADKDEIREVELLLGGLYLRWPRLDEDLRVQSLVEGTFGTGKWMRNLREHLAEIGRKGGQSRSVAKSSASRVNGSKGGRPRKVLTNPA